MDSNHLAVWLFFFPQLWVALQDGLGGIVDGYFAAIGRIVFNLNGYRFRASSMVGLAVSTRVLNA